MLGLAFFCEFELANLSNIHTYENYSAVEGVRRVIFYLIGYIKLFFSPHLRSIHHYKIGL
jgi:hypothetical protein